MFHTLALLLLLYSAQKASAEESIVVDVNTTWRTEVRSVLGMQVDATRNPEDITQQLKDKTSLWLNFPGKLSQVYGFAHKPYEKAVPYLLRFAKGSRAQGNQEWPSNDSSIHTQKNKDFTDVLAYDSFIDFCGQTHCRAVVTLPYDSAILPFRGTSKKNSKCYFPDCFVPTKEELIKNAAAWAKYGLEKKFKAHLWILGSNPFSEQSPLISHPERYLDDLQDFRSSMRKEQSDVELGSVLPEDAKVLKNLFIKAKEKKSTPDFFVANVSPVLALGGNEKTALQRYQKFNANLSPGLSQFERVYNEAHLGNSSKSRLMVVETSLEEKQRSLGSALIYFDELGQLLLRKNVFAILPLQEFSPNATLTKTRRVWRDYLLDDLVAAGNKPVLSKPNVLVYASRNAQRDKLNIFLINKSSQKQEVDIQALNFGKIGSALISTFASHKRDAQAMASDNEVSLGNQKDLEHGDFGFHAELTPLSINVVELASVVETPTPH